VKLEQALKKHERIDFEQMPIHSADIEIRIWWSRIAYEVSDEVQKTTQKQTSVRE
jgi:hypothetical protein